MRTNISLSELNSFVALLNLLKHLDLLEQKDFMITWEKRPAMIINRLGDFEFENPEEVYGCKIEFWDSDYDLMMGTNGPSSTIRFKVNGE